MLPLCARPHTRGAAVEYTLVNTLVSLTTATTGADSARPKLSSVKWSAGVTPSAIKVNYNVPEANTVPSYNDVSSGVDCTLVGAREAACPPATTTTHTATGALWGGVCKELCRLARCLQGRLMIWVKPGAGTCDLPPF